MRTAVAVSIAVVAVAALSGPRGEWRVMPSVEAAEGGAATFGSDLEFLKQHTDAVVLGDGKAQVAVVPEYQGRVMTSTAQGAKGVSLGWINREPIASGVKQKHINVYGGEDRFWLGPEGGQFGIYFPPKAEFEFEAWQTPAPIDTEPFELAEKTENEAVFRKEFGVTNWTGTPFTVAVERRVRLVGADALAEAGITIPKSADCVAYETRNRVTNGGQEAWKKDTGLLSIWILGMFPPSPETTIVIPFRAGSDSELGPKVNDVYFGKIAADRLVVEDDVLFFKADGKSRGKIGISPARAKGIAGSYDAANKILTLVTYNVPETHEGYVNSLWEQQKEPYSGDAINSYNDGPVEPGGKPLGPFYELETSSPALALAPGDSYEHVSRTVHIVGSEADLDPIAQKMLGVSLKEINDALK